jgi:GcrA cell cycle regulator
MTRNKPALSPELEAKARLLWENHRELTAAAIGERFGMSKSAIIGLADRRQWTRRRPHTPVRQNAAPTIEFPPIRCCVFPIGHPNEAGFHFCGAPKRSVIMPYCDEHVKVAYIPLPRN